MYFLNKYQIIYQPRWSPVQYICIWIVWKVLVTDERWCVWQHNLNVKPVEICWAYQNSNFSWFVCRSRIRTEVRNKYEEGDQRYRVFLLVVLDMRGNWTVFGFIVRLRPESIQDGGKVKYCINFVGKGKDCKNG